MFYLNECLKIVRENLILSLVFATSTFSILTMIHHREYIKHELDLSSKIKVLPYFNALVFNSSGIESIIRRMKQLPGVVAVKVAEKKSVTKEISQVTKILGTRVVQGLNLGSYKKLKIELENNLKSKNQNLIKEYLARLVGKSSVTMGGIKKSKGIEVKKTDFLGRFLEFADVVALMILLSLWLMSSLLLLKPINRSAYIIEKFQRKTRANVKIFLSGLVLILVPIMAFNFLVPSFETTLSVKIYSLVCAMIMCGIVVLLSLKKSRL